jgi:hypothetical protein
MNEHLGYDGDNSFILKSLLPHVIRTLRLPAQLSATNLRIKLPVFPRRKETEWPCLEPARIHNNGIRADRIFEPGRSLPIACPRYIDGL